MANERTMVTRWKSVVDPSVKRAANEVGETSDKSSDKMTAVWAGVGSAIGSKVADGLAWAAGKVKDFVAGSLAAASNLEQSSGAVEAVFKRDADAIVASAKQAADGLGLSKNSYQELASVLGAGLKNKGLKDYASQTQNLVKIGADLAAQYGGSTSDAVEALAAMMRGERDPIERYGVTMNEAMVQAEAFALGLAKPVKNMDLIRAAQNKAMIAQRNYTQAVKEHGKGSDEALAAEAQLLGAQSRLGKAMEGTTPKLNDQQKAQASLSLLTKQTADAQGAFAREADTAAGSQQRMAAKVENLQASLGEKLLPAQKAVLEMMHTQFLPAAEGLIQAFKDVSDWVGNHSGALKALGVTVGVLAGGYTALAVAQKAQAAGSFLSFLKKVATSTKAWAVVQGVLNVVMNANPIALVVIAIAALVAGVIYAYNNCKQFRQVVDTAFAAIGKAGTWLWNNALKPAIQAIVKGFAWVVDGIAGMLEALGRVPGFGWATDAAKGLRGIAESARGAAAAMDGIPDPKVNTGSSRAEVDALNVQIQSVKGKIVDAKARGDWDEVSRLKEKLADLRDKKVDVNAHVKKTGVTTLKLKDVKQGKLTISAYANGGIRGVAGLARRFGSGGVENHTAQIAPAGAWRLWAEPETGGEAYLPLSPAKRSRTIPMWWETGRRLGAVPFEDGGILGGSRSSGDDLAAAIRELVARMMTVEDFDRIMAELRTAQPTPRPAVRLG